MTSVHLKYYLTVCPADYFYSPYGEGSKTVAIKNSERTNKVTFARKVINVMKRYKIFIPLVAIGRYFKGSWTELRQVRWPNRRATWSLTAAVIMFTALFVAIIVALDAIFGQLFNLIIK